MKGRASGGGRALLLAGAATLLMMSMMLVAETPPQCIPVPVEPSCPAEAPLGIEACDGELSCEYGEECCCGECYPSLICNCTDGRWGCYFTDACLHPGCEEECPAEPPIGSEEMCTPGQRCEWGEECCCGECHPSLVCECFDGGGWGCHYTDACMIPFCEGACHDDRDCGDAICLAPDEPMPCGPCYIPDYPCANDAECMEGQVCEFVADGCICEPTTLCIPACSAATDCDEGESCDDSGHCVPTPCRSNDICPPHFVCNSSGLTPLGGCERRMCVGDEYCGGGYCVDSRCYAELGNCILPPP